MCRGFLNDLVLSKKPENYLFSGFLMRFNVFLRFD